MRPPSLIIYFPISGAPDPALESNTSESQWCAAMPPSWPTPDQRALRSYVSPCCHEIPALAGSFHDGLCSDPWHRVLAGVINAKMPSHAGSCRSPPGAFGEVTRECCSLASGLRRRSFASWHRGHETAARAFLQSRPSSYVRARSRQLIQMTATVPDAPRSSCGVCL